MAGEDDDEEDRTPLTTLSAFDIEVDALKLVPPDANAGTLGLV